MSRRDDERLADIIASADMIAAHLESGGFDDGLVFDAVRVRLIEIGEVVKVIDPDVLATESEIPWRDVAGMRDHLVHRYFDTAHAIVQVTVEEDPPLLVAAAKRLVAQLEPSLDSPYKPTSARRQGTRARRGGPGGQIRSSS